MAKKKKRKPQRKLPRPPPKRLVSALSEVEALVRRKRWRQALEELEALDRRYRNRPEVLGTLVNVYYELDDIKGYQGACERLIEVTPNDPDVTIGLAGAYLTNLRPALALRTFRRFLKRWPDHERAAETRETVVELEARMDDILADVGLSGADGLELAALHEEVQSWLDRSEFRQARQVARQLLRRRPDFAPALNNISQTYFVEGRLDQAIAASERVLDFSPDNYHALSNLARYLCLNGQAAEAEKWAGRLKAVTSQAPDVWIKKAEALSYLGDDEGVLAAFDGAEQVGHLKPPLGNPLLYHLAAVAALRLGREDQARKYWKRALKLAPGLDEARENLRELRLPVGERHAPWAVRFANWLPGKTLQALHAQLEPATRRDSEKSVEQATRRFLRQHPEIVGLVPCLLDRGDRGAREFALRIALMAETPEMLAALRDFALSQRGPDEMRHEAARAVSEAGLLPSGPVRLWMQGEWREILLLGFEIHDELLWQHQPQVEALLEEASEALNRGDGVAAEQAYKEALELEPDAIDVLNNLAAAYERQGRLEEAMSLVQQIHQRDPDYLFARTGLIKQHLRRGEIDAARALLEPLLFRQRFHYSEFAAFCNVQIELALAEDRIDVARSWLDLWAKADSDNPDVQRWQRQLGRQGLRRKLFGRRA